MCIVILRGNSGSGKTTTASLLAKRYEGQSLLISQDVVRREMLQVKDTAHNLSEQLMIDMINFGLLHTDIIILEGILVKRKYTKLFQYLETLKTDIHSYYFNVSFDECYKRQQTKKEQGFDQETLRNWWVPNDCLGFKNEKAFLDQDHIEGILETILNDIDKKRIHP